MEAAAIPVEAQAGQVAEVILVEVPAGQTGAETADGAGKHQVSQITSQ